MATRASDFRLSLIPIFITRLRLLVAVVPTLRELPQSLLDELQSLLGRAQELVEQSAGRPIPSESESAPEP
jgi:hypothetical protein